jgi:hypothetical protein
MSGKIILIVYIVPTVTFCINQAELQRAQGDKRYNAYRFWWESQKERDH